MQDFAQIAVVQEAHRLMLAIYEASSRFPTEEKYNLTSQMRSAAMSIPANVAEGCGMQGAAQLRRHAYIASGSASEVQYFLRAALDLGYLSEQRYDELRNHLLRVRRMLTRFIQSLEP